MAEDHLPQSPNGDKPPAAYEMALYCAEHRQTEAVPIARCLTDRTRLGATVAELLGLRHCLMLMVRPAVAEAADVARSIAELGEAVPVLRQSLAEPIVDHAYPCASDPTGRDEARRIAGRLAAMIPGGFVHDHPTATIVLAPGQDAPVAVICHATTVGGVQ